MEIEGLDSSEIRKTVSHIYGTSEENKNHECVIRFGAHEPGTTELCELLITLRRFKFCILENKRAKKTLVTA